MFILCRYDGPQYRLNRYSFGGARRLNHNFPLVNGEGQEQPPKGRKPDPFSTTRAGDLIEFSKTPARISVSQRIYRRGARAMRIQSIDGERMRDEVTIKSRAEPLDCQPYPNDS